MMRRDVHGRPLAGVLGYGAALMIVLAACGSATAVSPSSEPDTGGTETTAGAASGTSSGDALDGGISSCLRDPSDLCGAHPEVCAPWSQAIEPHCSVFWYSKSEQCLGYRVVAGAQLDQFFYMVYDPTSGALLGSLDPGCLGRTALSCSFVSIPTSCPDAGDEGPADAAPPQTDAILGCPADGYCPNGSGAACGYPPNGTIRMNTGDTPRPWCAPEPKKGDSCQPGQFWQLTGGCGGLTCTCGDSATWVCSLSLRVC